MDEKELVLLGSSIQIPSEIDPEETEDAPQKAYLNYNLLDVLESIGTDDFKTSFMSSKEVIESAELNKQIVFCINILEKIVEIYDYSTPLSVYLYNIKDVSSVYEFVKFLEYNYINFLSDVWGDIDIDLRNIILKDYCKRNSNYLIQIVDKKSKTETDNQLILDFLRTYNKDRMVEFIEIKTRKSRMNIVLEIMERRWNEYYNKKGIY